MITEASRKANKLFVMHSAKQISKEKDEEERERQAKDLEKKAKKLGLDRAEIEKILDDQGAYGEEYEMKKSMKTFIEFREDNKDALRRALAIQKFKKKGGKIDIQPPSIDLGRYRRRGVNVSTLSKDDEKRAKDIAQYRKDKKMKAKLKPTGATYGRGKKSLSQIKK